MVANALQKLSLRQGLLLAVVLALAGAALRVLIQAGQGWISLLAAASNFLWALALFVVVVTGGAALRRLLDQRRFDSDVDLSQLRWDEFEGYLAEYYRRRGATVSHRGRATRDGGVDLVIEDSVGRRILQAKHWRARQVGVSALRELWGVREDERADGAVVVTSGTFTPDAGRFAEGKRLELIDGSELRRLVAEVKARSTVEPSVRPPVPSTTTAQPCPACHTGTLTKRLARRGPNIGSHFLGCSRFPECRYIQGI